jgi:hypothetical protein
MADTIDTIGSNSLTPDKDFKFEERDVINFVFVNQDDTPKNITANLVGFIDKIEGRYFTVTYSMDPIKPGEVKYMGLDRIMVVKRIKVI